MARSAIARCPALAQDSHPAAFCVGKGKSATAPAQNRLAVESVLGHVQRQQEAGNHRA